MTELPAEEPISSRKRLISSLRKADNHSFFLLIALSTNRRYWRQRQMGIRLVSISCIPTSSYWLVGIGLVVKERLSSRPISLRVAFMMRTHGVAEVPATGPCQYQTRTSLPIQIRSALLQLISRQFLNQLPRDLTRKIRLGCLSPVSLGFAELKIQKLVQLGAGFLCCLQSSYARLCGGNRIPKS